MLRPRGNQMSRRISAHGPIMASTPSTRLPLDGVTMSVHHRSRSGRGCREMSPWRVQDRLVDFHTGGDLRGQAKWHGRSILGVSWIGAPADAVVVCGGSVRGARARRRLREARLAATWSWR